MAFDYQPFTLENTAGGINPDEDSFLPPEDNSAGGIVQDSPPDWEAPYRDSLQRIDSLTQALLHPGSYGQNAAQRWAGTPAVGLGIFQSRPPIFRMDLNGRFRRQIDGHTYMASPPEGLIGGKALENAFRFQGTGGFTPEAEWRNMFPKAPDGSVRPEMKSPASAWESMFPKMPDGRDRKRDPNQPMTDPNAGNPFMPYHAY